jgi:phosphoribosylamine--glycine ligase
MSLKVLVVGSGGREHALVRQLAAAAGDVTLYAAPGNPGTAALATNLAVDPADPAAVLAACRQAGIGLVIVGPEDPLIAGLGDELRRAGLEVFGPGALGARLEGDKEYAKEVMAAAGVPTPRFQAFSTVETALAYLDKIDLPVVVKATGAAAGKGVAVCATREDAEQHVRLCLERQTFGAAGQRILIEECLFGPELSVLAVTDGHSCALLAPSRDHKRIGEGDVGPNTGGMGAFAPVGLPRALYREIDAKVITPILAELRRRDIPYRGVLYAGLMLTAAGPRVLEFNCRFGDPETQAVLPLLHGDFLELVHATATGDLDRYLQGLHENEVAPTGWTGGGLTDWRRHCVIVVGAAEGYPGSYAKGTAITLPADRGDEAWIIHAGTKYRDQNLVTAGGRVLGAVGAGASLDEARGRAYGILSDVACDGLTFRRDIAAADSQKG